MNCSEEYVSERDKRLGDALAEYYRCLKRGEHVERHSFVARYPDLRDDLISHFEMQAELERIAGLPPHNPSNPAQHFPQQFGNYELIGEIERGGMGVVYKARQIRLNRLVALKMVLGGRFASESDNQRFKNEAEAAARLNHRNIVHVHDYGEHEGQLYFSMDYVEGRSLADLVREGPCHSKDAARYAKTIATAAQHAHQNGVLHRDLKPANVLINVAGELVIADFGLAKQLDADSDITRTHQHVGTPRYMSPEQAMARHDLVDRATDVYAIGAILYELMTGVPAFRANTPQEALDLVRNSDPLYPRWLNRSVPRDLETICLKCLEKDPERRYHTAGELAADLGRFLNDKPIHASAPSVWGRIHRWSKRNKGWAAAIVAMALAVLGVSAGSVLVIHTNAQSRIAGARFASAREAVQRIRLVGRRNGWSDESGKLVSEAASILKDKTLQDQAAACLEGVDATVWKEFGQFGAVHVAFDRDGQRLLMGQCMDAKERPQSAKLWSIETGDLADLRITEPGPVAFTPDGIPLQLVYGRPEADLLLIDLENSKILLPIHVPDDLTLQIPGGIGLSHDGRWISATASSGDGRQVLLIWQRDSGALLHKFEMPPSPDDYSPSVAFSPDASLVAAGSHDGEIRVWSLDSDEPKAVLQSGWTRINRLAFAENRFRGSTRSDADEFNWLLAAGNAGGTVAIWDLSAKIPKTYCRGSPYDVFSMAFSSDGMTIASGGRREVRLWDVATGRLLLSLDHGDFAHGLSFSPDGRRLAVACETQFAKGSVTVWQLEFGRGIQTLRGLLSQLSKVKFSPDGRLLAGLSHDWRVAIWDVSRGELRHILDVPRGITADNAGLAFSPRADQFAFAAGDEARLWDVSTGKQIKQWKLPEGLVDVLAFPAQDKLLLLRAETKDGSVAPYDTDPRRHPRVCRIRNLLGPHPTVLATIEDFNWHVFGAVAPSDGSFFVIEGRGGHDGQQHMIKAIDVSGGEEFTIPTKLKTVGYMALDRTGRTFAYKPDDSGQATLVELPSRRQIGLVHVIPSAISADRRFWVIPEVRSGFSLYRFTSDEPLATMAIDSRIAAREPDFSPDSRLVAWGNPDGTVSVCDIAEVQRRLAQFGLGWE